jgi:agmatine deiminase
MSFQVSAAIWGRDMVAPVQEALARIANAIIPFEPLNVIVAPENMARARALLDARIRLVSGAADDLWIRDSGCITVRNAQARNALSALISMAGAINRHTAVMPLWHSK